MQTNNADLTVENQFEERNLGEAVKIDGKTTGYKFRVFIQKKPTLEGVLSREEMDLIYKSYSNQGTNLSQKAISRNFPQYTFNDFKRILRAFNITKACSPFAPHILEEKSEEELIDMGLRIKENTIIRKIEEEQNRYNERRVKELSAEILTLKTSLKDAKELFSGIVDNESVNSPISYKIIPEESAGNLLWFLSDMHIGADVSKYSLFDNAFDYEEIKKRMDIIIQHTLTLQQRMNIGTITIVNTGDSLDGYNAQTTRGGHLLPQNMNNKDQVKNFINIMMYLFSNLLRSGLKVEYYAVGESNHDGDFGWLANRSLEAAANSVFGDTIEITIFDKFIEHFSVKNHTFVVTHGKDNKDMYTGLPLHLNDKVENYINGYLDAKQLTGNIHFIKGDLHQSANSIGRRFRYRNVGSFFGSSEWIHKNYGNTRAACDYSVILGEDVLDGRVVLN